MRRKQEAVAIKAVDENPIAALLDARLIVGIGGPDVSAHLEDLSLPERRMKSVGGAQKLDRRTHADRAFPGTFDHRRANHEFVVHARHDIERNARMQKAHRAGQRHLARPDAHHFAPHATQLGKRPASRPASAIKDDFPVAKLVPIHAKADLAAIRAQSLSEGRQCDARIEVTFVSEEQPLAAVRRMTMELSMSIAIVAAAGISQFFTALIITLFVLVAEVLEGMTVSRGRRAIRDLMDFVPRSVTVRDASGIREASTDELRVGDSVLVNPGGLVPIDGTVISGHSFVDQARITGESMPVEKLPGSVVYAGTINQSGALEIRVERIGRDTSYGRIIEAVEHAERSRAPVQQLADRLAGYLVYFALAAAAITFIITRDARSTISVIIVAGACGIAAGTPLAILGGIGRSARLGAIIKGGLYLETLGRVDTVVLDKTGTLTFGRTEVQAIVPAAGVVRSSKSWSCGVGGNALRASAGQSDRQSRARRRTVPSRSLSGLTTCPAAGSRRWWTA